MGERDKPHSYRGRGRLLPFHHGDEELDGEVDDDHARGGVEPYGGGSR